MKNTKRHITLLEIMIVIFLISIIGAAIGYNMKGSLERGKAFKTEQAISQIRDILLLEAEKNDIAMENIPPQAEQLLGKSGLVKNTQALMKDGWGERIEISVTKKNNLKIISKRLRSYNKSHKIVMANANSDSTTAANNTPDQNDDDEELTNQ